jgi:hypothetical protein
MNRMTRAAALAAAALLAACGESSTFTEATAPDTDAPVPEWVVAADAAPSGPFAVADEDYDFGRLTVRDEQTGNSYETDIHGYIRYPLDAEGPFPVLLFQHGRHQTCETGIGQFPVLVGDDNCPDLAPAVSPANSYRGYDYLSANLASHGYAVISIDANDINDNDGSPNSGDAGALARAELILRHLDAFRTINAQGGNGLDGLRGQLDFSRVGLMGHSRGGEGVSKTVGLNAQREAPHAIKAVFALAPTDYNAQQVSAVPFAALLPYCDGDVENLMGAFAYDNARYAQADDAAPKFQILAMGANHNYFNTVWTSDDWTIHGSAAETHCGESAAGNARDTPEGQRALGQFFMASFFRAFVGEEAAFQSYWTGRATVPASACPGGVAPCEQRYHLSIHPAASRRLLIDATPADTVLLRNALDLPVRVDGFSEAGSCIASGADGGGCPTADPTFSTAAQLVLRWDAAAIYSTELGALDARGFDTLSLRVGVAHGDADNGSGQDFSLALVDAAGAEAVVAASEHSLALFDPPGEAFDNRGAEKTTLNAVRVPLAAFRSIDRSRLQRLELRFDRTPAGTLQLTDLMLQDNLP